jgi:hypothetical protein
MDGRKTVAGELEAGANDDRATHVEFYPGFSLPAFPCPRPFDGSPGPSYVDPIENLIECQMTSYCRLNRPPQRVRSCGECLHPGKAGPCRGATHLCQVGTTAGDDAIEIEFP